jgi:cell division protein FtsQ
VDGGGRILLSIEQKTYRFGVLRDGNADRGAKKQKPASWFALADACADRAARAGFVLSMMFLAATAIYALSLSGAAVPALAEVAALADLAARETGFRLEDVSISGSQNTSKPLLIAALKLPYARSSLFYDTAGARERLLGIGWIENAEVRLVFPSRLEVSLSERTPFARWTGPDGQIQVIDREGRVLGSAEDGRFSALLLFGGQGAPAEAAAFLEALADHESTARRIERTELIAERFWKVTLDNGVALKLPRKMNALVLERLESLLANSKISDMALETIDLRLPHRTILQLREPTAVNRDKAIAALTSAPAPALPVPRRGKAL